LSKAQVKKAQRYARDMSVNLRSALIDLLEVNGKKKNTPTPLHGCVVRARLKSGWILKENMEGI
jgi:hypothetical protein